MSVCFSFKFIATQLVAFIIGVAGSAVLLDFSTLNSSIQYLLRNSLRRLIMSSGWPESAAALKMIQENVSSIWLIVWRKVTLQMQFSWTLLSTIERRLAAAVLMALTIIFACANHCLTPAAIQSLETHSSTVAWMSWHGYWKIKLGGLPASPWP